MTPGDAPRRRENVLTLARRLVSDSVSLAKLEVQHAREEIGQMLAETRAGVGLLAAAVAIGLVCLISLDVALILGVIALFDALPDVAVVIIMVATFVLLFALYIPLGLGRLVAGVSGGTLVVLVIAILALMAAFVVPASLGFRAAFHSAVFVLVVQVAIVPLLAVRGVRRIRIGPPEETIASVKEDVAWAKSRLLRRG